MPPCSIYGNWNRKIASAHHLLAQQRLDPLRIQAIARLAHPLHFVALLTAKRVTFKQAAEKHIAANESGWSAEHRRQWCNSLRDYVDPIFGDLPVSAIDQAFVLKALQPIWQDKYVTAARVRARIENVLDWAKANGLRTGDNPAAWSVLKHALGRARPDKTHFAAMPFGDVPAFLSQLRAEEGIAARALEITVLTALRTGEILGGRWTEIDLQERIWTIPAERMKGGIEHRVPLSDRVVDILTDLPREEGNPFVFVGDQIGRSLDTRSPFKELQRLRPNLTVHGFRSSFSDWAHERSTSDPYVIEMCLAHKVGTAVARAYRRGDLFDKRRSLMEAWSEFCCGEVMGKVVPLRGVGHALSLPPEPRSNRGSAHLAGVDTVLICRHVHTHEQAPETPGPREAHRRA